ncbi:MAG: 2,3-dehydroadipyl-CoA hydratase [Alphaproteobacteria bacterium]|nr:2,3-dehydroadipyl-CoA hydratase [Alphaproteobacteria bacterium]
MSEEPVIRITEPAPFVRLVTMNRPGALNALSGELLGALAQALDGWRHDEAVRAVVLTGGERAFAAGADIKEFPLQTPATQILEERAALFDAIGRFPKPLIAAVNGYALGGGCEVAMACDIIIAGETARFGQPEVNLGIIPGAGGTQRLPRTVGKSLAMLMCLAAEPIDAKRALSAGLVAEVTPKELTVERALAIAKAIVARPPLAVRVAKDLILRSYDTPLDAGLKLERRSNAALFGTEDKQEGVAAFIEKRPGNFKGR